MKLLILSDLHLEFAKFEPDAEAVAAADVVVLAGDIAEGLRGTRWAAQALPADKPVIYVAGNHEFYGHDWALMRSQLRRDCKGTNLHFLDNDQVVIEGVRFLGTTLWTDFMLLAKTEGILLSRAQAMSAARYGLNDFYDIRCSGERFMPEHSRADHLDSRRWLAERLAEPHAGPTVVVTHHAPSGRSGAPEYLGHELSPCFASNLPEDQFFGGKASVWIHGHMHNSSDYQHVGTRIVCNPRGYPRSRALGPEMGFENRDFDPKKIVEV